MPPSRIVISSESEKSFSFAVKNRGEERDHGKHRTPCSAGCRYVKGLSRIPFHPAAGANLRPFGAPPSKGRRECAAFPHRHFERKREILFVRGRSEKGRTADHGKLRTLCDVGSRCFMQTALRRKMETANEKDPSTALGMTIRERTSHILFRPIA